MALDNPVNPELLLMARPENRRAQLTCYQSQTSLLSMQTAVRQATQCCIWQAALQLRAPNKPAAQHASLGPTPVLGPGTSLHKGPA